MMVGLKICCSAFGSDGSRTMRPRRSRRAARQQPRRRPSRRWRGPCRRRWRRPRHSARQGARGRPGVRPRRSGSGAGRPGDQRRRSAAAPRHQGSRSRSHPRSRRSRPGGSPSGNSVCSRTAPPRRVWAWSAEEAWARRLGAPWPSRSSSSCRPASPSTPRPSPLPPPRSREGGTSLRTPREAAARAAQSVGRWLYMASTSLGPPVAVQRRGPAGQIRRRAARRQSEEGCRSRSRLQKVGAGRLLAGSGRGVRLWSRRLRAGGLSRPRALACKRPSPAVPGARARWRRAARRSAGASPTGCRQQVPSRPTSAWTR
mmetsp:Transcript_124742/g.399667  ORF Transcript_124742/g.399667 Transcript_124742/m.399667 type:complete len:315 (+) Transcript_124742:827-1771(+)